VLPLVVLLLAGCTGGTPAPATGPVAVDRPAVTGADVDAACAALVAALPDEIDPGVERRPVEPDEGRTAAWGDPAVVLECGVAPPERSESPVVVNGVGFTTRDVGPANRWLTHGRTVFASVTIPDAYENAVELVFPLAGPVDATLPVDPSVPPLVDPPPTGPEPSP